MERERDGVSRRGGLNKKDISTTVDIMIAWLSNDVRRVIEKACGIVADIDIMGDWGGRGVPGSGGSEEDHSTEESERG